LKILPPLIAAACFADWSGSIDGIPEDVGRGESPLPFWEGMLYMAV